MLFSKIFIFVFISGLFQVGAHVINFYNHR
jgi:hypothetical protein